MKLAKLLYLADLRAVKELGRPGSGVEWRWWHYGPFSKLLLVVEDDLVSAGVSQGRSGPLLSRLTPGEAMPSRVKAAARSRPGLGSMSLSLT